MRVAQKRNNRKVESPHWPDTQHTKAYTRERVPKRLPKAVWHFYCPITRSHLRRVSAALIICFPHPDLSLCVEYVEMSIQRSDINWISEMLNVESQSIFICHRWLEIKSDNKKERSYARSLAYQSRTHSPIEASLLRHRRHLITRPESCLSKKKWGRRWNGGGTAFMQCFHRTRTFFMW